MSDIHPQIRAAMDNLAERAFNDGLATALGIIRQKFCELDTPMFTKAEVLALLDESSRALREDAVPDIDMHSIVKRLIDSASFGGTQ